MTPFVILAEVIEFSLSQGTQIFGVPIGVLVAESHEWAYEMAMYKWPHYTIAPPIAWQDADPQVRLSALEEDRMSMVSEELCEQFCLHD